jgi:hypothetical protein
MLGLMRGPSFLFINDGPGDIPAALFAHASRRVDDRAAVLAYGNCLNGSRQSRSARAAKSPAYLDALAAIRAGGKIARRADALYQSFAAPLAVAQVFWKFNIASFAIHIIAPY